MCNFHLRLWGFFCKTAPSMSSNGVCRKIWKQWNLCATAGGIFWRVRKKSPCPQSSTAILPIIDTKISMTHFLSQDSSPYKIPYLTISFFSLHLLKSWDNRAHIGFAVKKKTEVSLDINVTVLIRKYIEKAKLRYSDVKHTTVMKQTGLTDSVIVCIKHVYIAYL